MIFAANPDADDCVLCDGPCQHDGGEAEVSAADLARLVERGLVRPTEPAIQKD